MPGMGISELPIPDGLVLRPFRGVRFAVDDPAKVTSPPYDLISNGDAHTLLDSHPNNVVRLILPAPPPSDAPIEHVRQLPEAPQPTDATNTDTTPNRPQGSAPSPSRYSEARNTLLAWLKSGVLVRDEQPALYVYEQRGQDVLQRGLIGDVGLTDPAQRIILPHEDVLPGPITDRLALMSTTQANLEPIFLLYNGDHGAATTLVDEVAATRPPLITAHTEDDLTHRLWCITDQAEIDAINADLHPRQALIADGHHRYATYRVLQRQQHLTQTTAASAEPQPTTAPPTAAQPTTAPPAPAEQTIPPASEDTPRTDALKPGPSRRESSPWDFGLALLVDSTTYAPNLQAIHRVIPDLPLEEAVARARGSWRVHDHGDLEHGLAALGAVGEPAFLLAGEEGVHLITDPDPVQLALAMPADHSDRWNSLNTSILTEFVLPKVWGLEDNEQTVRIVHHDAQAAARLAITTGGTAVILKPLAMNDVLAVAAGGERVPRKSTSFGPKPRTGLVLRTFATD
ncbi:DUF1015 family protein [Nonomuraea glycinis]|uniref:DUF1015 family protein n=1 Tax=Nonomuraea glycinis TaxID=2047744 RepID=UPI0027E1501E|nr:DUF1015 family protein [Nonomuraea glycinis]